MSLIRYTLTALCILLCDSAARAEVVTTQNGTDTFIAGGSVTETLNSPGDTFVAAQTSVARGAADGDLHVAGFEISISADVGQDLYAAGATVVLRGSIGEDLSAAGFSVRSEASSTTKGNARFMGKTVTIEGPVQGAVFAAGGEVMLNAPIAGDIRIVAQTLHFGDKASVAGTLTYSTENEVAVPERVAPAERVVYEKFTGRPKWDDIELMKDMPVFPTAASILFGFIVMLFFFLVLGAIALGFMPNRLRSLRKTITEQPGLSALLGVIGLSMLFGMVPIAALTIVGLPFVPIVILAGVVAWTLGYALGAYALAMRLWVGFGGGDVPSTLSRLAIFAVGIAAVSLLNFIPFVGWVVNYTLVLLGIGAMTHWVFQALVGNPFATLDVDMKQTDSND